MKIEDLELNVPIMDVRNSRLIALHKVSRNEYYIFKDASGNKYQYSEDYLITLLERKEFIKS